MDIYQSIFSLVMPSFLMSTDGLQYKLLIGVVAIILAKHDIILAFLYRVVMLFCRKADVRTQVVVEGFLHWVNSMPRVDSCSKQFKALMDRIHSELVSQTKTKYVIRMYQVEGCSTSLRFVEFDGPFTLDLPKASPGVACVAVQVVQHLKDVSYKDSDGNVRMTREISLCLTSSADRVQDIEDVLKDAMERYEAEPETKGLYVFTAAPNASNESIVFEKTKFESFKTFDNMFFWQKKDLKERLDVFQNGEASTRSRCLGLPHTFGILLHGAPGTGKTSAIKSLARYTERHIVVVPTSMIKTERQLFELLTNPRIGNMNLGNMRRLYVFEEIDCSAWAEIVHDRNVPFEGKSSHDQLEDTEHQALQLLSILGDVCCSTNAADTHKIDKKGIGKEKGKGKGKENGNEGKLSLGYILEMLDGMIEMPGRMIVMTSNHPERLDPALTRHGRIDMNIEFRKMKATDVANMFELWFKEPLSADVLAELEDERFSQAEIGNLFSTGDVERIELALKSSDKL
jgi:ATPase family associated with various cellular activities (AAA)